MEIRLLKSRGTSLAKAMKAAMRLRPAMKTEMNLVNSRRKLARWSLTVGMGFKRGFNNPYHMVSGNPEDLVADYYNTFVFPPIVL